MDNELLNPDLLSFDLPRLAAALRPSATSSSTIWACKRCTTATSCTEQGRIELPQASSCAWPWAWRCKRR